MFPSHAMRYFSPSSFRLLKKKLIKHMMLSRITITYPKDTIPGDSMAVKLNNPARL